MLAEALVPITLFIGIFSSIIITTYINRTAKHKERMSLLEKGLDASIFEEKPKKRKEENRHKSLKWGMVAVAVGMGLLVGSVLDTVLGWQEVAYFSMILLFGGAALIAYYLIMDKKYRDENKDNDILV